MDMSIPPAHAAAPADAIQLNDVPRRGTLYRVHHEGKTSYLFGTIHVGKQDFFPLEAEVTEALAKSSALVLELDVRASEPYYKALARHGQYPAGQTVRDHLSPAALARLQAALETIKLPLAGVEHYRPWVLANILVGQEIEKSGFNRGMGVEAYLLHNAAQQKKPLLELENADYQLGLFGALSDAQQEAYLLENIADIESGAALRKSAGLVEAWGAADASRIAALTRELTSGDTVSARFMDGTLLGKRNPEMAAHIEAIMRKSDAFIGIGLLHLVGDKGVPALLRQHGYQVEKVY
ncbi:TraB/GumN family protein [Pseudoduganella violaceinigra]|uniref:TraB/GumN family protein n=1 Tax=Pseudoduganella violaceinigra TaxID=246602 RepID=UPI000403B0B3|nr:TraB/GumN family protein [Pseudoduganella violaceinigra]